jgi:hypothetical protein
VGSLEISRAVTFGSACLNTEVKSVEMHCDSLLDDVRIGKSWWPQRQEYRVVDVRGHVGG